MKRNCWFWVPVSFHWMSSAPAAVEMSRMSRTRPEWRLTSLYQVSVCTACAGLASRRPEEAATGTAAVSPATFQKRRREYLLPRRLLSMSL